MSSVRRVFWPFRVCVAEPEALGPHRPLPGAAHRVTRHQQVAREAVRLDLDPLPPLAGAADDRRLGRHAEEVPHRPRRRDVTAVQAPVADLVREAEVEPSAHGRPLVGIERLVDADEPVLDPDGAQHVGYPEPPAEVVHLEAQAEVLQEVVEEERRHPGPRTRLSGVSGGEGAGFGLDLLVGDVRDVDAHLARTPLLILIVGRRPPTGQPPAFRLLACSSRRRMSSGPSPRAVRRKLAISRGRSLMMSLTSEATLPASASSSSGSWSSRRAMSLTRASAGGGSSSRSILDREVALTPIILANGLSPISLASRSRRTRAPNRSSVPLTCTSLV